MTSKKPLYDADFSSADQLLLLQEDGSTQRRECHIDPRSIARVARETLDPVIADLVRIGMAVYAMDRVALRRRRGSGDDYQWARTLRLKIGVAAPELWSRSSKSLSCLLAFLTEDSWSFDFVPLKSQPMLAETQGSLPLSMDTDDMQVALFSGGLDSFAGAARALVTKDSPLVLVSGYSHARQYRGQSDQVNDLARVFPHRIEHVPVSYGIETFRNLCEENSQRARSFLYLMLGAATAMSLKLGRLEIYENGIGAINLPFDHSQLGTMSSRAVHPLFLHLSSRFVSDALAVDFAFVNLYLFSTKAEMCRGIETELEQAVGQTFSCDGYPVRVEGKPQCGTCSSCLLRRLSVEAAGLSAADPGSAYLRDLVDHPSRLRAKHLRHLEAMAWQMVRIDDALESEDQWSSLVSEFPELTDVEDALADSHDRGAIRTLILRLYSEYLREWEEFSIRKNLQFLRNAA